jgi:hypothetical protein
MSLILMVVRRMLGVVIHLSVSPPQSPSRGLRSSFMTSHPKQHLSNGNTSRYSTPTSISHFRTFNAMTMATSTVHQPVTNGICSSTSKPLELAFTLPSNPHTQLHLQLTVHATTILLFATTTTPDNSSQATPLGSFVYALPDRYNPSQPLSTPIYSIIHTLDFTQRLAKLLARKTGRACYVGNSASFRDSVQGGIVEEEMEAFRAVVKVVMGEVEKVDE